MTILPLQLRRTIPLWIGLPLLMLCTVRPTGAAAAPKWEPVSPEELADNTPRIEPEAPAEILNYRLEIDEEGDGGRRDYVYQLRIKIYDPDRSTDITRLARFWVGNGPPNPYYQVLARLTLPDGTSRLFDENDLRERDVGTEGRANGFAGLLTSKSDWSVAQRFLVITGVEKGAILDVWERDPRTAPTDWLMSSIQRPDIPIRKFEYVCRYVPKQKILRRFFLLNPCGGHMTHDEKAGVMGFAAENLPSIRREPFAPPDTYFSLTIIQTKENLDHFLPQHHLSVPKPVSVPLSLGPWAFFWFSRFSCG